MVIVWPLFCSWVFFWFWNSFFAFCQKTVLSSIWETPESFVSFFFIPFLVCVFVSMCVEWVVSNKSNCRMLIQGKSSSRMKISPLLFSQYWAVLHLPCSLLHVFLLHLKWISGKRKCAKLPIFNSLLIFEWNKQFLINPYSAHFLFQLTIQINMAFLLYTVQIWNTNTYIVSYFKIFNHLFFNYFLSSSLFSI